MQILLYFFIAFFTFIIMEGFTWWLHKYVMHGFMWFLHKDHHEKGEGVFEKNDWFFLIFAIPSWLLIMLGVIYQAYWSIAIGTGLTLYGLAYFIVHEVIIHQRIKLFTRSDNNYIRTIRWAHKMHHKHINKHEGESFGFLWVAKKYWDKIKDDNKRNSI
ncbi:MAG: beta-carotene hydroxylase [Ferruginibacter sp.]|nr:beta-carotene hydroxylase [Ferruginibacter sp.]